MTNMKKQKRKWYVGDRFDNWDQFDTLQEAYEYMALGMEDVLGEVPNSNFVYMLYLTSEQFQELLQGRLKV